MKHQQQKILGLVLALLVAGLQVQAQTTPPRIPVETFFGRVDIKAARISPDGEKIGFLRTWKEHINLFILDIATQDLKQVTSFEDQNVDGFQWIREDLLLYSKDNHGDENTQLFLLELTTLVASPITPGGGVKAILVANEASDQSSLLIAHNSRDPGFFDLYRYHLKERRETLVYQNPGTTTRFHTAGTNEARFIERRENGETIIFYRDSEESEFAPLFRLDPLSAFLPLRFNQKGQLYALTNAGNDTLSLVLYSLEQRRELRTIYSNKNVDIDRVRFSKKHGRLLSLSYFRKRLHERFFDSKFSRIYKRILAKLPRRNLQLDVENSDLEERRFVVRSFSEKSPGDFHLYDAQEDRLIHLGSKMPALDPDQMATTRPISYRARDGTRIHGYLTVPQGLKPRNLPVVINPHGGPWLRDVLGYNAEVQFLANRGYAVLQMNFRGSSGYGRDFLVAGFRQWGGLMQDDVTDATRWLIRKKIADPKRIAIYGASYGGYVALAGLAFTPDLYACGISYAGISNLLTSLDYLPPYSRTLISLYHRMVGNPNDPEDAERMRAVSPLFHTDEIQAPLLVAHGARDARVSFREAERIVEELRRQGKQVEYLLKEDEGHGFEKQGNIIELYKRIESFLAKHL